MTDTDSASLGLESLRAFKEAKETLLKSLTEVEATIARNEDTRRAIVDALGEIGVAVPAPDAHSTIGDTEPVPDPPVEKKQSRRGKKAPETAVKESAPEAQLVEAPEAEVVDHLPSSDTQNEIVEDAEAKGEDSAEALDDWTPGNDAKSSGSSGTYDALDFDEIQF